MLIMLFAITIPVYAATQSDSNDIEIIYKNAYNECKAQNVESISNDYDAYTYLLHNLKNVNVTNGKITVTQDIYNDLNSIMMGQVR